MKGKYLPRKSWEKQAVFELETGHEITIEYHQCYGEFVKAICKDGECWRASNGLHSLPTSFQLFTNWIEPIGKWDKWMVPKFERVY